MLLFKLELKVSGLELNGGKMNIGWKFGPLLKIVGLVDTSRELFNKVLRSWNTSICSNRYMYPDPDYLKSIKIQSPALNVFDGFRATH